MTVLHRKGIFYELIETVYGAETEKRHACIEGLRVFREGFALLTEPVPEAERTDAAARTVRNDPLRYELVKPAGFLRYEVDTATDPGCRLRIERIAPVFRESVRQARVELRVDNPRQRLKPGMFVRAEVVFERVAQTLVVPEAAFQEMRNASAPARSALSRGIPGGASGPHTDDLVENEYTTFE